MEKNYSSFDPFFFDYLIGIEGILLAKYQGVVKKTQKEKTLLYQNKFFQNENNFFVILSLKATLGIWFLFSLF